MPPTLDLAEIERDSMTTPIPAVVDYLQGHLGQQVVAYVAGLENTQMLSKWLAGTEPRKTAQLRLRYAYRAARMIIEVFDEKIAEAWLFGANSKLDDDAPAWVLRNAQSLDDLRFVIP